jgi:hypothetical protein
MYTVTRTLRCIRPNCLCSLRIDLPSDRMDTNSNQQRSDVHGDDNKVDASSTNPHFNDYAVDQHTQFADSSVRPPLVHSQTGPQRQTEPQMDRSKEIELIQYSSSISGSPPISPPPTPAELRINLMMNLGYPPAYSLSSNNSMFPNTDTCVSTTDGISTSVPMSAHSVNAQSSSSGSDHHCVSAADTDNEDEKNHGQSSFPKDSRRSRSGQKQSVTKGGIYISDEDITKMMALCDSRFDTDIANDEKAAFGYFKESKAKILKNVR